MTFDGTGTWSLKYNLVWDDWFGFGLFPKEVKELEVRKYLTEMNRYGTPLDSRETYTKSDWVVWAACLTEYEDSFQAMIGPLYRFLTESPDRIPFSDWHWTESGEVRGFRARSVVGGTFMRLLQ